MTDTPTPAEAAFRVEHTGHLWRNAPEVCAALRVLLDVARAAGERLGLEPGADPECTDYLRGYRAGKEHAAVPAGPAGEGGERPLCVNGERDAGPWEHDDGSPCDVHLCSRPYPRGPDSAWWCTDHQQHVHPAAASPRVPVTAEAAGEGGRFAIVKIEDSSGGASFPVVERVPHGWQSGAHHYADHQVAEVVRRFDASPSASLAGATTPGAAGKKPPGGLNTAALIATTLRRWGADLREEAHESDAREETYSAARVSRFVGIKLDGVADAVELLDSTPSSPGAAAPACGATTRDRRVCPGPVTDGVCELEDDHHGVAGIAPAAPAEDGELARRLREIEELLDGGCCFEFCPGPDEPYVGMATCRSCAARQELRALASRVDTPAGDAT